MAGAERPVDLEETAVYAIGGGDGSFDAGDAVFFYAEGPRGWYYDQTEEAWRHYVHPFSMTTHAFLQIGAEGGLKVVEEQAHSPAGAVPIDRFTAHTFIENDLVNLGQSDNAGSGYDWLGELVDEEFRSQEIISVTLPGMTPGTARYRSRIVARSNPAATLAFVSNGVTIAQKQMPVVFTGANSADSWSARDAEIAFEQTVSAGEQLSLELTLTGGNADSKGWLDWLEVHYPRSFEATDGYLSFTLPSLSSTRALRLRDFETQPIVWDVTDRRRIKKLPVRPDGDGFELVLRPEFGIPTRLIAFTPASSVIRIPDPGSAVDNQDLHGNERNPEFVIITPSIFLAQATELARHRESEGLSVRVVDIEHIYNEFSGGTPDMRAVRDYLKFLYDREAIDGRPTLRYALLFGDGHFDFRGISEDEQSPLSPNWIFPFETPETLYRQASYTSDDYFGLLDDHEGTWDWPGYAGRTSEVVDIGIGRFPVQTVEDAETVVRKIFSYESPTSSGRWRTRYTFAADDGPAGSRNDRDLHTQNADIVARQVKEAFPQITQKKVYAISYPVETTVVGRRIPTAKQDLLSAIREGTLLWNYSGHGGWEGLADERLFTIEDIEGLDNKDKLTVFITATCSFGAFDRAREQSGAELLLTHEGGGAVALMTTVRLVVTWDNPNAYNLGLNLELNRHLLARDENGLPLRLGDVMRLTKSSAVGMQGNNRKFNLLGDPSMRLALPRARVDVERINGKDPAVAAVPLRALDRVTIDGVIRRPDGSRDAAFDGVVDVSVFDAARTVDIPEEDRRHLPGGGYSIQNDLIYRGKVTAQAGSFTSSFVVPRDISYSNAQGRISLYAESAQYDGLGAFANVTVGGTSDQPLDDREGPEIALFLNDTTFVSGGTTNEEPVLIARLFDDSGINTVGTGVGHELLLVVDEAQDKAIEISDRFEAELDSYQNGRVSYQLPMLEEGFHTLSVRAWDVLNNSTTKDLEFFVAPERDLVIRNLYTYPNPTRAGSETRFVFEHNQPPGTPAEIQIRIYSLDGRVIRQMDSFETLPEGTLSNASIQIPFNGRDQDLDLLSSGIYLYKVRIELPEAVGNDGIVEQIGKLAVIR